VHLTRRNVLRALGAAGATLLPGLAGLPLSLGLTGCAPGQVLSDLRVSAPRITPNGLGVGDECKVGFTLADRATVAAWLTGPDGKRHDLHAERTMAPDDYEIDFKGVVTLPDSADRRVLPNGLYKLFVRAQSDGGQPVERSTPVEVADADTAAPEVRDLVTSLSEFTPNGDGDADEVTISYGLSKAATTTVYVTDAEGQRYLIEAPMKKNAVLVSHLWDGKSGNKVVKDGQYTFAVEAQDAAGNLTVATTPLRVSNAGTPRLEIVEAKFSPIAVPQGGKLNVRIKVKNNGDTLIKTMGPEPGSEYTTNSNFTSFRDPKDANRALYFERPGRWRVGVQWTNAPQLYPVRWGLFKGIDKDDNLTLAPGDETIVEGTIQVLTNDVHEMTFWASIVQEGVGYPGGQVGLTKVKVSF
jgi:hypothetical protein